MAIIRAIRQEIQDNPHAWRYVLVELINMLIVLGLITAFGFLTVFYEYLETSI